MATVLNKCRFRATAGSTTDFTVDAAIAGFVTPASAGAEDAVAYGYYAFSDDETVWELASGAWDAINNKIARTTIIASSSADAKVNFAAAPQVQLTNAVNVAVRDADNTFSGDITFEKAIALADPPFTTPLPINISYITSTTNPLTIPAGATRAKVRMQGVGGGGGYSASAPGTAGGYLEKFLTGLVPGNTLVATIGTRGADGGSGEGGTGGATKLESGTQSISTLTANGGRGGDTGYNDGGTATGGDINIKGGGNIRIYLPDNSWTMGAGLSVMSTRNATANNSQSLSGYGYGGAKGDLQGGPGIIIIEWYP